MKTKQILALASATRSLKPLIMRRDKAIKQPASLMWFFGPLNVDRKTIKALAGIILRPHGDIASDADDLHPTASGAKVAVKAL